MEGSSILVASALIIGALVSGVLWLAWAKAKLVDQLNEARKKEGDAARLPDALQRLSAAENLANERARQLQELTGRESALTARAEENERQIARLTDEKREQVEALAATRESLSAEREQRAALASRCTALGESFGLTTESLAASEAKAAGYEQTIEGLRRDNAELKAALAAETEKCRHFESFLCEAEQKLGAAFVQAASKVFDEKSVALEQRIQAAGEIGKQGLDATLKPFAEKVSALQARIETINTEQTKDRSELQGRINELASLNRDMASSTQALTRALKGNAQVRGAWGEMILETVLRASGLQEGTNYTRQQTTENDEDGKRLRPDVVITLPDGKQLVVDSKVNLIDWAEYNGAECQDLAQQCLLRHTAAVRKHVLDLASKNYPGSLGDNALEVTILFVPIEGALAAALATNPSLQDEAFRRQICFASPNTLMAMLRVVERLWTRDTLQKQIGTIADQAGKVLDALILFDDRFKDAETALKATQGKFEKARTALSLSDRSVMRRAEKLVQAGAKGKKAIPEILQPPTLSDSLPLLTAEVVHD